MTEEEIKDKLGALHLRLMDDEENYNIFINLLLDYLELSDNFGAAVISALKDGMNNLERFLKKESALSLRSIVIEKKETTPKDNKRSRADVEGCYRLFLILDDESRLKIRFDRKQSHLLYILILLCSLKNGFMADFFLKEENWEPVLQLIRLIYPHIDDKTARLMVKELASNGSFSDIFQKMKEPIMDSLKRQSILDDQYWYVPYSEKIEKKRLYKVHIPQPQIVCPDEFLPIVEALPNAADFLTPEESDSLKCDINNAIAKAKEAAEKGDVKGLYKMGLFHGTGDGVSQDYKLSKDYFEQADKGGCFDATFQLGVYHMYGFGCKKNIRKALRYFERAAANGHAEAASWAGQIYDRGTDGVRVDHHKAFNLYMIAAKQDNEEGMWYVIQGYLQGQVIEKNFAKAYEWFQKADALGYARIKFLFGFYYWSLGDIEALSKAYRLFMDACNAEVPQAFFYMASMVKNGFSQTDNVREEVKTWLLKGALLHNPKCISELQNVYPSTYAQYSHSFEERQSMRDIFISTLDNMDVKQREYFIQLVDAYSERWHERYLVEMCKQLNIHKKPNGREDGWKPERHITIRKSSKAKLPYEIVLTLANGDEVIIDKMNNKYLALYLLAIICSYKSGYTTQMAKDDACKPILRELVQLVLKESIQYADYFISEFMDYESDSSNKINKDYYKQYSKETKKVIKKAIGVRDDDCYFLFDNVRTSRKKMLRRINLDCKYIDIPQELMKLADRMPDALEIINLSDNQTDKSLLDE